MITFQQKLDLDLRKPIFTIPLSSISSRFSKDNNDLELGLLLPSLQFWIQLGMIFVIQTFIGMIVGSLVYSFIIKKREALSKPSLYLLGYGIFIPSLLYLPFHLIEILDLRNSVFNIVIGGASVLQALRCISAIHGTITPKSIIEQRRQNNYCFIYCIYFCSIVDLKYDKVTGNFLYIPHNQRLYDSWTKLKKLVFGIIQLTIMYSFMDADTINYKPFQQQQQQHDHLGQTNIFDWRHIADNMCFAYTWHLCLLTGATAFQLVIGLCTGIQSTALTDNPLFGSSSPSDFWGRRWNNVVHKALKDSIYRPLIPHCHAGVAAIAVFFTSGLLHEYILLIGEYGISRSIPSNLNDTSSSISSYKSKSHPEIQYGLQTIFFLWNAIIIICEYYIVKKTNRTTTSSNATKTIQTYSYSGLPLVIVSLLVIMTVLPIAHFFSQGMMEISVLEHYKIGYPMFVVIKQ